VKVAALVLQMVVGGMADRIADLEGGLAAAQKVVEELKEQGAHSEGKREQQQREEVAALQLRLEQVFGTWGPCDVWGRVAAAVAGVDWVQRVVCVRSSAAAGCAAVQLATRVLGVATA
jgi:uncharacterized coiled-coil protein SlyX